MLFDLVEKAYLKAVELEEAGRFVEAAERYLMPALNGHNAAQLNLGNILDDKITPPRPIEARKWYRRAATRGYAPAAWNLALHYRKSGKELLYERWLERAAQMGDEDAIERIKASHNKTANDQ